MDEMYEAIVGLRTHEKLLRDSYRNGNYRPVAQ
jgi:hypothetical protein